MKYQLNILFIVTWASLVKTDFSPILAIERYFDQNVDHNDEVGKTFKQKYFENLVGERNSLKFLFIGGAYPLSMGSVTLNYMSQAAEIYMADRYALEHRYYGNSQPVGNFSTDNLRYLTIEQAIEDIVGFKRFIDKEYNYTSSKWVLWGSGYAGALALWARKTHPDEIYAVVASGAPVEAKMNLAGLVRKVGEIIKETDSSCYNTIKQGMASFGKTFRTRNGRKKLQKQFKACKLPKTEYDKYSAAYYIIDLFIDAITTNVETACGNRLQSLCKQLLSVKGDSLTKLATIVSEKYREKATCVDFNYGSSSSAFSTKITPSNSERQGLYQQCTQLGYFITTGATNQPFAHALPIQFHTKMCRDAFGNSFTPESIREGIRTTNNKYNGQSYSNFTNSVVVYGEKDPWKDLGVLKVDKKTSKIITIKGGWHNEDVVVEKQTDNKELKKARAEILAEVERFSSR